MLEKNEQDQPLPENFGGLKTGRKIGEILIADGLVEPGQVETALDEQRRDRERKYIGLILMRKRLVQEREVFKRLSRQRGVLFHEVRDMNIPDDIIDRVPRDVALEHNVLPVDFHDGELSVTMDDPFNQNLLRLLRRVIPDRIKPGFATRGDLHYAVSRRYNSLVRSSPIVEDFFDGFAYLMEQKPFDPNKVLDLILAVAHLLAASDIHLTFGDAVFNFGLRIEGMLHAIPIPARRLNPDHITQLRNALRIRSGLDLSRRATLHGGWIEMRVGEGRLQAEVSMLPLVGAEKVVAHIIRDLKMLSIDQLGFSKQDKERIKPLLSRPSGLILIIGPAGSGRSTTLHALLDKIPAESRHVVTIEDPIQARLQHVSQVEVGGDSGLSFLEALRAVRRQDVNVLMLDEIRDAEAAQIAVELANSGRLVLSSLCMEQSAGAILRLLNIGVEPASLATSLRLVIAQRLVPGICLECHAPHPKSAELCHELGLPEESPLFTGTGCTKCYYTGRSGRVVLFETIVVDDELRDLITSQPTLTSIINYARSRGTRSFREDAVAKCLEGKVAPEDVITYS